MDRGREALLRATTVFGAALALAFSLLTAFLPGLAYGITAGGTVFSFGGPFGFRPQIYGCTIGMLVSGVGALLCLVSLRLGRVRLGFAGALLSLSGFPLLRFPDVGYFDYPPLFMFWWGPGLVMLGVLMMFWGLAVQCKVVPPRLTRLACLLAFAVWLLPLLLTTIIPSLLFLLIDLLKIRFLIMFIVLILPVPYFLGILPMMVGSAIGILNEYKQDDLMPLTFLLSLYWIFLALFTRLQCF